MNDAEYKADIELVAAWIDLEWYLRQSSSHDWDIKHDATAIEAAKHYLYIGSKSGLTAHPYMSNYFYSWCHSDVKDSNVEPFLHFLKHGHAERRLIHPLFTSTIPLAALQERHAISQYASTLFDGPSYLANLPDPIEIDPLEHYLSFGCLERRLPTSLYNFSLSDGSADLTPDFFVRHYCAVTTPVLHKAREVHRIDRCVLVLGMHRSGTSALCGVLSQLGLQRPIRELPPQPDNPRGFFEPERIVDIHNNILSAFGTSWLDCRHLPNLYEKSAIFLSFRDLIATCFVEDFPIPGTALLKDPRLNKMLLGWRSILKELNIQENILIVTRHPASVIRSLKLRDGIKEREAMTLWLSYTLDAERQSRGSRRSFIEFNASDLTLPEQLCQILSSSQIPHLGSTDLPKKTFIDQTLCHFVDVTEAEEAMLNEWARQIWHASKRLVTDSQDREAMKTFDLVLDSFRQACDAFADPLELVR